MNNGFRGFPERLHSSVQRTVPNSMNRFFGKFPLAGKKEIFYSIKDGAWTDPTIWETVSGRVGNIPSTNDTVYVKHAVTLGTTIGNTLSINHLFISGILTVTSGQNPFNVQDLTITGTLRINIIITCVLNVNGNLNVSSTGLIDFALATVNVVLTLNGINNVCPRNNYLAGTTILAYGALPNKVLDLNYYHLTVGNYNTYNNLKYLETDLVVNGNFIVRSGSTPSLELQDFNLTVNGTSLFIGIMSKSGPGNLLFVGNVQRHCWLFSGNPNIEFRGGISLMSFYTGTFVLTNGNWGTGTVRFTTNNQTINITGGTEGNRVLSGNSGYFYFANNFIIDSNIVVTLTTTTGLFLLEGTINGNNSSSQFVNKGTLYFNNTSAANAMTTGIFDTYTFANTIGYVYAGNDTIYQTSLSNLFITSTGTKTLIGNTSLSAALLMNVTGISGNETILELSSFDLSVGTTTTLALYNKISKTGSGNVLFTGLLSMPNMFGGGGINFTGNPTVEFRNGINVNQAFGLFIFNLGSNTISFTTNNQSIIFSNSSYVINWLGQINIVGAINLTFNTGAVQRIYDVINGTVGGSTLTIAAPMYFMTSTSGNYMTTGTVVNTSSQSTIGYMWNGNYTIPLTTFQGLAIGGTGTKSLSGNTTVATTLNYGTVINNTAGTLDCDIYNLSNSGTTLMTNDGATLLKTGAGNILFVGLLTLQGNIITLDLSGGNPTVEMRGGITCNNFAGNTFNTGTGLWSFTTNNQTIQSLNSSPTIMNFYSILISGAITVTMASLNNILYAYVINTSIDGDNVSSKLLAANTNFINYKGSTQPMITTGLLDVSTNANTFIYGNGNQDIKGGTYRNLTLNGGGVKTLQGNVSVLNTYTLTAPATKNNNGFTFGNP